MQYKVEKKKTFKALKNYNLQGSFKLFYFRENNLSNKSIFYVYMKRIMLISLSSLNVC